MLVLTLELWLKLKLKLLLRLKLVVKLEQRLTQVRAAVPAQVAVLEDMQVAKLMLMQLLLVAAKQMSMLVLGLAVMQLSPQMQVRAPV